MAEPNDTANFLDDASTIARTIYMPALYENQAGRFGSTTNRLVKIAEQVGGGFGIVMQSTIGNADSVRFGNAAVPTFDSVGMNKYAAVTMRFSDSGLPNDFSTVRASVQFTDVALENKKRGLASAFAQDITNDVLRDYDEALSIMRNIGRNGIVALVNGTPELNNGISLAASTGTATNAGGLRCAVDGGVFAALKEGQFIDFINPSNGAARASQVRITDKNEGDLSIGVEWVPTQVGSRVSSGNLANVADNDYIVRSDQYNAGMYSFGAWFSNPSAGESFIGGVDRTTANYRWMNPIDPRRGGTASVVTKSMFDDVAIALGYREDMEQAGLVCQGDLANTTALRNQLGEPSFIQLQPNDERTKKFYNFGSVGLNYQHPTLGIVKIVGDPLCPANTFRFINPSTWVCQHQLFKGLRNMEGQSGGFYRVTATTPNTGLSAIWKSDWYGILQDFCLNPKKNAQISNITPS